MKSISKTFFAGLAAVLPAVATGYLLVWLTMSAEAALGKLIRFFVPHGTYRPGMGVAAAVALVFLIGLMMQAWFVRRLVEWGERLLSRVPLIKSIYGPLRDFTRFLSRPKEEDASARQVAMVTLGDTGIQCLGFVTRREFTDLPPGAVAEGAVAVYLPMSYQIGGYTLLLPRSAVTPLAIPMDQAMKFAVTAGMTRVAPSARGKESPRG